jgi:hypothetical protein
VARRVAVLTYPGADVLLLLCVRVRAGVLGALGPEWAPRVFADCLCNQLCVKTLVLAEPLSMASCQESLLEACNTIYLMGAREMPTPAGVWCGIVHFSADLAMVEQQSDRWHQRHALGFDVCPVLTPQEMSSWVVARMGLAEEAFSNDYPQSGSGSWGWLSYCRKSGEGATMTLIIIIALMSHALRAFQDWWLLLLYQGVSTAEMPFEDLDQEASVWVLLASVACTTCLLASASALWSAIVAVSTAKHLHGEAAGALCRTSLAMVPEKNQWVLDLLGVNKAISAFPHHVQASVSCFVAVLACLILMTVEILTIRGSATPPETFVFLVVPVFLLAVGLWSFWGIDYALRRVSHFMAAARGPVRALFATTADSMRCLRIYPQNCAALETMQHLLDRSSSAQLAVYAVQTRSLLYLGCFWCLGAVLAAMALLMLKASGVLLTSLSSMAVAGLVLALAVQVVLLAQWSLVSASHASISFHAFVGRTKHMCRALVPDEVLGEHNNPAPGEVVAGWIPPAPGEVVAGWMLDNVHVASSPLVPAALVSSFRSALLALPSATSPPQSTRSLPFLPFPYRCRCGTLSLAI